MGYLPLSLRGLPVVSQGLQGMINAEDRCLIVEDNYLIFTDIEDIVMASGFKRIDHASTLAEAVTLLGKNQYRLALLDFRLGVLDSLPLAETLVKNKVPFAVTTGYPVDEFLLHALKGAPVISKPYGVLAVNRVIAGLLSAQPAMQGPDYRLR